jgi:glyoxylase-like metal-dependent hydrolase (beta-lactamase superfamily II)
MNCMKMFRCLSLGGAALLGVWVLRAQGPDGFGAFGAPKGKGGPPVAVDFSGWWTANLQEDSGERGAGPELVDYGGIPINEAGRLWALSYDTSRLTSRFHQCDGYVAPYSVRAIGNTRVWEERDPKLHTPIALHWYSQTFEGHRVIWLDGRPHPPAYAPHTWMGFSTGTWVGNALRVETTHLKQGWLRRNGLPESDQATLVEFFVRHGDHITYTSVITDPVYLSEPWIRTTDFYRNPTDPGAWLFPCEDSEQVTGRAPDQVPNYLFGEHPYLTEYATKNEIALLGALGGAETMYGEFEARLKTATEAEARALTVPAPGPPLTSRAVNPDPQDGEIHILPIRNNVYMLVGDGGNIVVQTGDDGPFVVNTGAGQLTAKVLAAIRSLSPKPIRMIANTSFHPWQTGGNAVLKNAGSNPSVVGTFLSLQAPGAGATASILAHENVTARMNGSMGNPPTPPDSWPIDTFLADRLRRFHNGDSIEMFHMPNASTDGDSIVHFRRADVIVAGDILDTTRYPVIDLASGGSVQGLIKALNAVLDRTVFEHSGEGGTYVVPGRGYLCDEHEVVEYRDMVAIIRDRVNALIRRGASLAEVKAARVTADYDTRYGANTGPWTTEMFVEAVYNSLKQNPRIPR